MNQVPLVGRKELKIQISNLCISCWPQAVPAVIIYHGHSLCIKCVNEFINNDDIDPRTWLHDPIEEKSNV